MLELFAAVLLLAPRLAVYGAILGTGLMGGAIGSHLTKLGIVVMGDGGLLIGMAVAVLAACVAVVYLRREQVFGLLGGIAKRRAST